MKHRVLCWEDSWLSLRDLGGETGDALPLWTWKPKIGTLPPHRGMLDKDGVETIGGEMVERRPDRMDCGHIPHDLLSKLYDDCGQMRAAVVAFGHRTVMFVEGHAAMFYKNFRLPIPKNVSVDQAQVAIHTMLAMCDTNRARPEWLMCFRCRKCGGYVLAIEGKDRLVEYFTGYIDKGFKDLNKICKLPDDYPAKTCIDCGDIMLTGQEALEVGIDPTKEEVLKFVGENPAPTEEESMDGGAG